MAEVQACIVFGSSQSLPLQDRKVVLHIPQISPCIESESLSRHISGYTAGFSLLLTNCQRMCSLKFGEVTVLRSKSLKFIFMTLLTS